jgi:hypothetical protein
MKLLIASLFALAFVSALTAEKARFDNYRVYEILIENDQQLELMQEIENYPDGVRKIFCIIIKVTKVFYFSIVSGNFLERLEEMLSLLFHLTSSVSSVS